MSPKRKQTTPSLIAQSKPLIPILNGVRRGVKPVRKQQAIIWKEHNCSVYSRAPKKDLTRLGADPSGALYATFPRIQPNFFPIHHNSSNHRNDHLFTKQLPRRWAMMTGMVGEDPFGTTFDERRRLCGWVIVPARMRQNLPQNDQPQLLILLRKRGDFPLALFFLLVLFLKKICRSLSVNFRCLLAVFVQKICAVMRFLLLRSESFFFLFCSWITKLSWNWKSFSLKGVSWKWQVFSFICNF